MSDIGNDKDNTVTINYSSFSTSSSSSFMKVSEFVQADPLQLPQAGEHLKLCFLHMHLILLQSVRQLHLIIFRSSSGAGGKSVSTGTSFPSLLFHPPI